MSEQRWIKVRDFLIGKATDVEGTGVGPRLLEYMHTFSGKTWAKIVDSPADESRLEVLRRCAPGLEEEA